MISNERHWPTQRQPRRLAQPYYERPNMQLSRPPAREDTLETRRLQVERKQFLVMLKENLRGRFLRIAEEANGRSNSIIIPFAGLHEFQRVLDELVKAAEELPPAAPAAETPAVGPEDVGA